MWEKPPRDAGGEGCHSTAKPHGVIRRYSVNKVRTLIVTPQAVPAACWAFIGGSSLYTYLINCHHQKKDVKRHCALNRDVLYITYKLCDSRVETWQAKHKLQVALRRFTIIQPCLISQLGKVGLA